MSTQKLRQLGQGMTEYIIIVALIAIAAIAIYGLFGDTVKEQMGVMTEELAGNTAASNIDTPDTSVDDDTGSLSTYAAGTAE